MQREVRKTVSVVVTDVAGSTSLAERLDPESLREVMIRYFDAVREVHERHGGVVEKFIGDAVMAVFGVPRTHEDDALHAVRAAGEFGAAVARVNRELESGLQVVVSVRTGVNTGLVMAGDAGQRQSFVGGDTVNLAARLERAARAGEVLLGEATYRLVADAVRAEPVTPFVPRGRSGPVAAYRLLEVLRGLEGADPGRVDGAVAGPGWVEQPPVPPAVPALIEAELDCLTPEERAVLELASVIGPVFEWASVAALAPATLRPRVGPLLLALARRNLIRAAEQQAGEDALGRAYRYLAQLAGHDLPPLTPAVRPVQNPPVGVTA